jgi:hypothetical protein
MMAGFEESSEETSCLWLKKALRKQAVCRRELVLVGSCRELVIEAGGISRSDKQISGLGIGLL